MPAAGPGELLIRVEAASVCGTDVHIERWDGWAQENFGPPPMTFGHEMAGVVVAQGAGATRVAVGERVTRRDAHRRLDLLPVPHRPRPRLPEHAILGVHVPGAFAEYVVMPEANAWVYEGLSPEIAALQEPLGNAVHAAFVEEVAGQTAARHRLRADRPDGDRRAQDGRRAAVYRHGHQRRAAARWPSGWAPTWCWTAATTSSSRARAETDGNGVDIVLEMSGAQAALHQGLAAVTNGGRVSLLGTHTQPATIDLSEEVIFKGIRIYGITGRRLFDTWYRTTALLEEGLDLTPDHHPPPAAVRVRPGVRPGRVRATPARSCCCRRSRDDGR